MSIPVSSSLLQLNAETFLQEGFELSLDAIVPSIILTGSFSTTTSKTQFYIYNYAKTVLYENLNYQANGSYLTPENVNSLTNSSSSYNQFELTPVEDVYNQGYSSGKYYTIYNFINYELGSELIEDNESYEGHPYFLKDISGDRTEIRIANNFLTSQQIETYYNQFTEKLNALENADEFYISFGNNRNFIGVNYLLETSTIEGNSILIKLYKPLPSDFQLEEQLQIITKAGETQAYEVEFSPNLEFIDNLLSLKGPNYNVAIKDRVNNSTNFKSLNDLINTNSSQSYYQFSQLQNQKGIILRKNWGDWNQFVKYSSAEQRLDNFYNKLVSIESSSAELAELETITNSTTASVDYSSSYNNITNNINQVISKFDSYEYFLYYITGSESWPKRTNTYPYDNYSVTSSAGVNWFGSTNETSAYFNSGKNQIYSASRYDNDNQDYLYYLIPPFITENNSNDQYIKFVNMTGQSFDEMFIYTEAVEQVRNTNSPLTGSVLPLGLADEVIESLGFETYANDFNSIGFNVNGVGVFPSTGSGLEYIDRYIDIASGSVINYYDQQQSTLGFVIALADPSFPYPIENSSQEIYKRIFHNMISLVKRKGTVTGLRQLINIWGVPNTMLRISEFGGKNKDDENDYDLWMNRYSTALTTYNREDGIKPSGSIMIPWYPLLANEVQTDGYASYPDNIQFRFKTARSIADTNFSESLLLKKSYHLNKPNPNHGNDSGHAGDFGITLIYSGSNSGSYSGASEPHYNTYATMSFVISASTAEGGSGGGHYISSPIYLPFYNENWWTVQLQRMVNIQTSSQNNLSNTYELRVGQNIYDGYDGNQIGWEGSSSIVLGTNTQSVNFAWNLPNDESWLKTPFTPVTNGVTPGIQGNGIMLGGSITASSTFPNGYNYVGQTSSLGYNLGDAFSGSFQEFRYYRRALSQSQFNDFVMNPQSIQGHADSNTGAGSSYDLLSFRLPLGNELEYTNPPTGSGYYNNIFYYGFDYYHSLVGIDNYGGWKNNGSVHPAIVNSDPSSSLFTASFRYHSNVTGLSINSSNYSLKYYGSSDEFITASYLAPNIEINYMDQPSAGIRNRIKNKIQVIDGNEYGTTLSPFRSIQQEFEQSGSYTEDLNSLEVGFSFQNEINDDIISTFGHGVVSDAIADPRILSESGDRYPELTRIAEDYFKKYQGYKIYSPLNSQDLNLTGITGSLPTVIEKEYDYNRLIKFYETSLFKAIKNYVPARTSLSTGIIVKQHLLERNRTDIATGINIDTVIAKTSETGSENGLNNAPQSNNSRIFTPGESGFNSPIQQENLLITSSIAVGSLTGSAGGSVNKYNNLGVNTLNFNPTQPILKLNETDNITLNAVVGTNLLGFTPTINAATNNMSFSNEDGGFFETFVAYEGQLAYDFTIAFGSNADIDIEIRSDKRGVISTFAVSIDNFGQVLKKFSPVFNIYPNEKIKIFATDDGSGVVIDQFTFEIGVNNPSPLIPLPNNYGHLLLATSASQQVNWYRDNYTGLLKVKDTQEEFYNGEYSGSNIPVELNEYNPYRIYADGNDQTPDTVPAYVDFTLGGGDAAYWNPTSANTIEIQSGYTPISQFKYWTGSFQNLEIGQTYTVNYTVVVSNANGGAAFNQASPINPGWAGYQSTPTSNTYNFTFIATDDRISGTVDNGGIYNYFNIGGITQTVTVNSIVGGSIGPKHFYERDSFTIMPTSSWLFQNSPYNPLLHNVSGSRKNSFLYDMDFDPVTSGSTLIEGRPNDYSLTVSASQLGWEGSPSTADALLEYAQVPDSNYTTKAIINPRYNGSKVISADYNFYTGIPSGSRLPAGITGLANPSFLLKQNKIQYINGETGSWTGDTSYGKTAVIDRNPINIAHFKSSLESKEYFGTTTFNINQLIQVPFEEILNEQSPIITSSLINGSNENLVPMSSTFMPGREATIIYNQSSKTFNNVGGTILNYTNLGIGSNVINAGGIEFKAYQSNQILINELSTIQYFDLPIWYNYKAIINIPTNNNFNSNIETTANSASLLLSGSYYGLGQDYDPFIESSSYFTPLLSSLDLVDTVFTSPTASSFYTDAPSVVMAFTGSRLDSNGREVGILNLRGPNPGPIPAGYARSTTTVEPTKGPFLLLANSQNNLLKLGTLSNGTNTVISSTGSYSNFVEGISTPFPIAPGGGAQTTLPIIPTSGSIINAGGTNISEAGSLPVLNQEEKENDSNYFRFNFSASNLPQYRQNIDTKILIERGDEIRVSYSSIVNEALPSVTNKITQDFTVLGYDIAPPCLMTTPFTASMTRPIVEFDIACTATTTQDLNDAPPTSYITGSLPSSGYYSFNSLLEKYQTSLNNNDWFYLSGLGFQNRDFASGSITAINTKNVITTENGQTGIIGITCSLAGVDNNNSLGVDVPHTWAFGTSYLLNRTQGQFDIVDQFSPSSSPNISPYLLSASISPIVEFDSATVQYTTAYCMDPGYLFDRIKVTPNPNDLETKIPAGKIYAITLRKRVEADDRVVLNVNQPSGSAGALTLSGDGYLIPNDLTEIQQRNVQKIINKLKSENVFTPDSNDLQS
jgi:hypothetical protein